MNPLNQRSAKSPFRAGSGRTALMAPLLVVALLGACSSPGSNNFRRSEARDAALLTNGPPQAVALHAVATTDFGVQELEVVWVDEARQRAVPARIFVPKGITPGLQPTAAPASPDARATLGSTPLIVFSHGLGGSRLSYMQLGRHWASQGFMSIHLQHAGSDRAIWTTSGLAVLGSLKSAASTDNAIARARDVSFAIDQVQKEASLSKSIDLDRIAVAGHSFGANTALLAAGAQFRLDGKLISFGDPRIKAAIVLSPPSLPGDQDPIYVYNPIRIPTFHLTGTRDDTPIPGLSKMANQRSQAFDSMVATPRYLAVYEGGRHSMFHDRTVDSTSVSIKNTTKALSTLFLRSTLMQDQSAELDLAKALGTQSSIARWETKPAR
jgi:predicted dienelactone hydrolase